MAMANKTLSAQIKSIVNGNLPTFQGNSMQSSDILNFIARFYGTNSWLNIPPPGTVARPVANVSAADMQIILDAGQTLVNWVNSNCTIGPDGSVTPTSFTKAQLAPLVTQLQSILSSL